MGMEADDVDGYHQQQLRASSASARHQHGVSGASVAEVNLSTRHPFVEKVWSDLAETFFPNNPFRGISVLLPARHAWGALKYLVPVLDWAPRYGLVKFKYDLLAGITIAGLAIPQGISYARLANLPPIIGLCTFELHAAIAVRGVRELQQPAVGTVAAASQLR
uniref:SLC26A/SulP transporter domain-containing protein n=1 Tax=Oryza nivara TaxID=4536 RepID=A0A0E0HZ79_ORYNI